MADNCGVLYVCATPIGNLGDITVRALETLKSCGYIAAEDTRRTLKLMNYYNIKAKLLSCHEHNEVRRISEIIAILKNGNDVALVSDAGMPGISDPGARIIAGCYENGINVTVCPGASAFVSAAVLSGYELDSFLFSGFLPRDKSERKKRLLELRNQNEAVILYEAPHRLKKTLKELLEYFGNNDIAIIKEITKIHEQVVRTTLEEAALMYNDAAPKGEFVLVINKKLQENSNRPDDVFWCGISVSEHVEHYENEGLSSMDAIKKAAKDRGAPKSEIYRQVKGNR